MSHSPDSNCRFNRKNSLTRRLILFLLTAPPTFLVMVTPNRERPCRPAEKTAIKYSFCILRPDSDSAINSWRFKILSPFVKENCIGKNNYRPPDRRTLCWQSNPTFGSPAVNDSSTLFSRHSFKKTMISGPFNSTGLKCPFHFKISLSVYACLNFRLQHTSDFATDISNRMS